MQRAYYRPLSFLPIPAKCFERIDHSAIYDHVAPFLSDWQHKFIKGRSCVTQLVLTYHHLVKCLYEGRQTNVVFLDFAKVFDRVPHDILLQQLFIFGLSGSLLNWCANYLSDRYQDLSWVHSFSLFLSVISLMLSVLLI